MATPDGNTPSTMSGEILRRDQLMRDTAGRAAALQPVEVGTEPCERFLDLAPVTVARHRPRHATVAAEPILIIYSMINRPYLLDLQPRRSVVRGLTEAGFDVYVLDWGHPGSTDGDLDLDECIEELIHTAVTGIRAEHGVDAVNLMGICQGGTLAACYAALQPDTVRTLATLATPIDFHTPDDTLTKLVRGLDFDAMARLPGNARSGALNAVFVGLKPFRLLDQRYFDMPRMCGDDEALADFLRMERWMYDSPDQPMAALRTFGRDFYQRNALYRGELRMREHTVDLGAIRMPVFNAFASHDHLVPPDAARALEGCVGSADFTTRVFPGGHLGLFVSGRAHREIYPAYIQWAMERQVSRPAQAV